MDWSLTEIQRYVVMALCCGFILVLFQSTTANKIDSENT